MQERKITEVDVRKAVEEPEKVIRPSRARNPPVLGPDGVCFAWWSK